MKSSAERNLASSASNISNSHPRNEEEMAGSLAGSGSGASETSGSSPSSQFSGKGAAAHKEENPAIAHEENKNVFRLRLLVMSVLLASTVAVAAGVFLFVSNAEQANFENQYEDDSEKVLSAIGSTLDLTLGAVDTFLVGLVSYGRHTNSSWPYVTLPDYAVRLAKLRSLSKAIVVSQWHHVTAEERPDWEKYSSENDAWVRSSIETQTNDETYDGKIVNDFYTRSDIHGFGPGAYDAPGPYLAKWQTSPVVPVFAPYNFDAMLLPALVDVLPIVQEDRNVVIGNVFNIPDLTDPQSVESTKNNNDFIKDFVGNEEDPTEPFSDIFFPILDYAADFVTIPKNGTSGSLGNFVGLFTVSFYWRDLIQDILPEDSDGIIIVFENSCDQKFTYQVNGPNTVYIGSGDRHETEFDNYLIKTSKLINLDSFGNVDRTYTGLELSDKGCSYTLRVYPSKEMQDSFTSSDPLIFTLVAVAIFAFTSLIFVFYDCMVERRQAKVMQTALHTNAIVSSLFPSNVRDRLFRTDQDDDMSKRFQHNKSRLKSFLSDGNDPGLDSPDGLNKQGPIADLFPHCTVLFSDISGFTAWSSVREPSQVFTLLETLYGAFDHIAMRRGVFKVETIGDAYVAVAGLPEPRKDHPVVMAKFARDCLIRMIEIVRELEKTLGPGTGELRLRFGLHSGEVTAGVLRGQKSRFQLFGDTVNVAARMESTGVPNRIQASTVTAELLIEAGKGNWVKPREERVEAKGKGFMQTYWIDPKMMGTAAARVVSEDSEDMPTLLNERTKRLVDWNKDILSRLVRQIIAKKKTTSTTRPVQKCPGSKNAKTKDTILDEVCEIIELPAFDPANYLEQDLDEIDLDENVSQQLGEYIVSIASLYNDNPFHCFDHASHVGMSTAKLLSRIVKPEAVLATNNRRTNDEEIALSLHQHTFGITSDPLAQFACVFSALIHDLDHPGVPNNTLVKEKSPLALRYKDKSVAEQNSADIAWDLFMTDQFDDLRAAVCPTPEDLKRFRQLVVNIVMATDIMDPDLKRLRNDRWEKAFSEGTDDETSAQNQLNRKATIVMEHLIQASDVAHTMQHWHIYQKWNERLFDEMYVAYQSGRSDKDPSEFWYEGEISFLDNYILPLAKKLRNCGVFGVSSDEYLNYAMKNRNEWALRGRDVVAAMVEKRKKKSSPTRRRSSMKA